MGRVRAPKLTLSERQKEVVNWNEGSLLVSAGPGSGKTRVITERITRLIKNGVVNPSRIFATTFTRKAANEMNERLVLKGIDTSLMAVQTTHAFARSLLIKHKNFKDWSLDKKDTSEIVLNWVIGYKNINWKGVDPTTVKMFIALCRNSLVLPEESHEKFTESYGDSRYSIAYIEYHNEMKKRRLYTFDDMLYYGVRLLIDDTKTRNSVQNKYHYVLVDEFQDSNAAQIALFDIVARPDLNYMIVGDIDQAIYSWRGALPEYMLKFKDQYNARMITLSENYRCSPAIIEAGSHCIKLNKNRITKELIPVRTTIDKKIKYVKSIDSDEEATTISEEIKQMNVDGIRYQEIKVLMRTNDLSRACEEEFIRQKIPFVVLGSISFYERKEIKNLLSYLRAILDPTDVKACECSIRNPFRKISRPVMDAITEYSDNYFDGIYEALQRGKVYPSIRKDMEDYYELMTSIKQNAKPRETLERIIEETNYIEYLYKDNGTDTPETSKGGNVYELISSSDRFDEILDFITYIDMQIKLRKRNEKKKDDDRVQIMSIHKSKGTEAISIFLIGTNEGIIPHVNGNLEEERRLFYVALTRAKDNLFVCSTGQGVLNGPSRFLYESKILEVKNENKNKTPE